MQTYLTVSVRSQGDSAVVEVGGELDLGSSAQLEQALQLAWREDPQRVLVELGELQFIDMAGLRVLLQAHQYAGERGAQLILAHARAPVRRLLALAHVDELLTIQENHR